MAWAVSRLCFLDSPLLDAIAAASSRKIREFRARELANTAWSLATLRLTHAPLLAAISSASIAKISDFRSQELANTLWACARLALKDAQERPSLEEAGSLAVHPQEVSSPASSSAALAYRNRPLLPALSAAASAKSQEFRAQELANTAWALAQLRVSDAPLLHALSSAAISRIKDFGTHELGSTAWSYARLSYADQALSQAISAAAIALITEASGQCLSKLAWSVATLASTDLPLLEAIAAAAIPRLSAFSSAELASTAWSFATLSVPNGPLLAAIAAESLRTLGEFNFQSLAMTAWAYAELSVIHQPLMAAIAAAAIAKLGGLAAGGGAEADAPAVSLRCLARGLAEAGLLEGSALEEVAAAFRRLAAPPDGAAAGRRGGLPLSGAAEESWRRPRLVSGSEEVAILYKPPGWTATVAEGPGLELVPGEGRGRPLSQWLQGAFGAGHPIAADAAAQWGLVHRLDLETSGLLLWARSYRGHFAGQLSFLARRVLKEYVCLCCGHLAPSPALVTAPLLTRRVDTGRGTGLETSASPSGRQACTELLAAAHLSGPEGLPFSLVTLRLHTGRTHQIRAHLRHLGHPLAGDAAYGGAAPAWCPRVFLHARRLCLALCGLGAPLGAVAPLPPDLQRAAEQLALVAGSARPLLDEGY